MNSRKEIFRGFVTAIGISTISIFTFVGCGENKANPEDPMQDLVSLDEQINLQNAIVGGTAVDDTDSIASSTVAMYNTATSSLCTASIVGKNLAVTAAHCADSDLESAVLIFSTKLPDGTTKPTYRKVVKGQVNAKYSDTNDGKDQGDIALLRFEGSLPTGYKPALILRSKAYLKKGMTATIAGYGNLSMTPEVSADRLMKADIQVTDPTYSSSEVLFDQFDGKGACHGDSGGPAFVNIRGKQILFGVTSRSATENGGMTCLEGSIYTSVSAYLPWLKSVAAQLMRD